MLADRAWVSSNTEGSYKRSAVLGILIGWLVNISSIPFHSTLNHFIRGNLNGAVTSNVASTIPCSTYSLNSDEPESLVSCSRQALVSPRSRYRVGIHCHRMDFLFCSQIRAEG